MLHRHHGLFGPGVSVSDIVAGCHRMAGVVVDEGLPFHPDEFIDSFFDELQEYSELARKAPY